MSHGAAPSGDLIPWTVGEQFQDKEFPCKTGIRIVRVATHSQAQRMGYGTRALQILSNFYEGKIINLEEDKENVDESKDTSSKKLKNSDLNVSTSNVISSNIYEEILRPKKKLKPLLLKLCEVSPNFINWIGTSFGLTNELYNFWKKNHMYPVYLKLSENDITGEHSCIMLKAINLKHENENLHMSNLHDNLQIPNWLTPFAEDFKRRVISYLAFDFRKLPIKLALSLLDPQLTNTTNEDEIEDDILIEESNIINKVIIFYYLIT